MIDFFLFLPVLSISFINRIFFIVFVQNSFSHTLALAISLSLSLSLSFKLYNLFSAVQPSSPSLTWAAME